MSGVTIDWSSAEVREGRLEVALHGEPPDGWKQGFERTLALLHSGDWGAVKLKKGRIRVQDLSVGSEERLRHFLESVVTQANADVEQENADDESDEADASQLDGLDADMTERFRSFAANKSE